MNGKREYFWCASRAGGFMFFPSRYCCSQAKIRTVCTILFRKWFGYSPITMSWHKDGFMAECWDRRGNRIQVEQVNRDMRPLALLPERCSTRAGGAA